jgi:hypothetical protein
MSQKNQFVLSELTLPVVEGYPCIFNALEGNNQAFVMLFFVFPYISTSSIRHITPSRPSKSEHILS